MADPEADEDAVDLLVEGDPEAGEPVALGDSRQKHVTVTTAAGERVEHGDVYLAHSATGFRVSTDPSFPEAETTRYAKADLRRVEVTQHHAACFITTAVAGEGPTLDALRGFRDDALDRSPVGRRLVWTYYAVSPPVARTLARHPDAGPTRAVRRLVEGCAVLARRRSVADGRLVPLALTVVLTLAYALGLVVALAGSAGLRVGEALGRGG